MKITAFWFDGGKHVQGWSDGDEWNGWGVPLFDEKQLPDAIRVLSAVGFHVERRGPVLQLTHKDEDHSTDYKPETIAGRRFWRIDGLTWNHEEAKNPMTRTEREHLARAANRGRNLPKISATSSKSDLHKWFEAQFEDWDREYEGGYTLDQLWDEVRTTVEATVDERRRPSRNMRESNELRDTLKGWSVGYDDEISAYAAVRSLNAKNGRRRLLVMTQDDREPHDPNASVELGLYELDDEDNWYLAHYEDFDTPADAARASREDREWA